MLAVHKPLDGKIRENKFAALFTEPLAQAGIAGEFQQSIGDRLDLTAADQKPRATFQADLVCAVEVVGQHGPAGSESLRQRARVRHLREKLERDPGEPSFIVTVRGVGYRFRDA